MKTDPNKTVVLHKIHCYNDAFGHWTIEMEEKTAKRSVIYRDEHGQVERTETFTYNPADREAEQRSDWGELVGRTVIYSDGTEDGWGLE